MGLLLKIAKISNEELLENVKNIRKGQAGYIGATGLGIAGVAPSIVNPLGWGSQLYSNYKLRDTAKKYYGKDFKKKYVDADKPGSFAANNPFLSTFLPIAPNVSAFRGATHFENLAKKQKDTGERELNLSDLRKVREDNELRKIKKNTEKI